MERHGKYYISRAERYFEQEFDRICGYSKSRGRRIPADDVIKDYETYVCLTNPFGQEIVDLG